MTMSLDHWQARLERHFDDVASARSYTEYPLFALEHGLSDEDHSEIAALLHDRLRSGGRLGQHWLVWVVYATELGYDYDGGEYWPSFEQRTPGWREAVTSNRRNQLRSWFAKFHATYHGVKPSGPWAEQFSIIAWPITHAIVPRYLQWQFARTFYNLRYQLAHMGSLSPHRIGELLAANAWDASSRFREFLQQQELVGRLVVALLSDRAMDEHGPIFRSTLERLVLDLEEVHTTRDWLTETKRLVSERLRGSARVMTAGGSDRDRSQSDHALEQPRLRPTLLLRRSGVNSWSLVIEIPTFAQLARFQPELSSFLNSTRCRIAGTGDTWLPRSWLLGGARRRVVHQWPGAGAALVRFEKPQADWDQLVGQDVRIQNGPVWLCRIGNDGLGHEVAGKVVRPGQSYLVLSEEELPVRTPYFSTAAVECSGVRAYRLNMPATTSFELTRFLQEIGLQIARSIRIWPAGLSPRRFDGEGRSEWLTTESPCFGITHDHPVETYSLRLDSSGEVVLNAPTVGTPIFVSIPPLPAGRHTLLVKARRTNSTGSLAPSAEGLISLDVREPEPWIPGTTSHAGLAISLDSDDPTLDSFWEGQVGVNILGPAGRQVTCEIILVGANGKELLTEHVGTFDLPVSPSDWLGKFQPFARDDKRTWIYLEAVEGRLVIKGEELGEYTHRLERDVTPVRWACKYSQRLTSVRLIDDSGVDGIPTCRLFSFRQPTVPVSLDAERVMAGMAIEAPGGIFEASHGKFKDAVNISIPPSGQGFADLLIEPDLHALSNERVGITEILELLRQWCETRGLGPLVEIRKNRIVDRLAGKLYLRLCGQAWAAAEAAFLRKSKSEKERRQIEVAVGGPPRYSFVLSREFDRMDAGTSSGKAWFAGVSSSFQISTDAGLCEFALQLASRPHELLMYPRPVLDSILLEIKDKTILLRGARLVALLSAARSPGILGGVFPRWKW